MLALFASLGGHNMPQLVVGGVGAVLLLLLLGARLARLLQREDPGLLATTARPDLRKVVLKKRKMPRSAELLLTFL